MNVRHSPIPVYHIPFTVLPDESDNLNNNIRLYIILLCMLVLVFALGRNMNLADRNLRKYKVENLHLTSSFG